ncbi:MAG: hypothetical protein EXS05_22435 [Planctomycetaceae bacterium]|nr:hypothetical protein [Planctomycetaceae bacterium]
MDSLRLILFIGGGGILAIIGLVAALVYRQQRQAVSRAAELLHQCGSPQQAQQQLVAEGMDPQQAVSVMPRAVEQVIAESAARLLGQGVTEADAVGQLVGTGLLPQKVVADLVRDVAHPTWFQRHPFVSVMLGLPLMALGAATMFGGLVLRDGNRSGKFVTFPFAGALTIMLGIFVFVMGLTFAAVPFARFRDTSVNSESQNR